MSDLTFWTAMIAAGAAILSSILTSYLTHLFEHRQRRREYELRWLEERFGPAVDFLGKVLATVSNTPSTHEGRTRTANEIHNIVTGPSKDSNAWYVGILLDPENTGLRDYVQSAMTYARIEESNDEFLKYQAKLYLSLEELAEEYRRERQAIVRGKPLESLIRERKTKLDKATQQLADALQVMRAFAKDEVDLDLTLTRLRNSGIRAARLQWVLNILAADGDQHTLTRLQEVRRKCVELGWLSESQE